MMAESGISRLGKTVRSLCSLRAKSRLLYAHDRVCGCFSSQRRHLIARPDDGVAEYDVVIIGTGIVGLGTALEMINRYPNLRYAVLDKETKIAAHQTGNNSGVIHAGIYYLPGTLKAKLCVEGASLMYQYCDANKVPYKKVGKLIVAVDPVEVSRLDDLYDRSQKNGVLDVRMLSPEQIKDIEPNCTALKALHSPHTGIVDFTVVTQSLAHTYKEKGGKIHMGFKVTGFSESWNRSDYPVTIEGVNTNVFFDNRRVRAKYVITCAGLHSDRLAIYSGCSSNPKIVPFRGEYLKLKDDVKDLVHSNIYPVPDPSLPFLGVHFTPRMNGDVWLGPNALLAFKREGYRFRDFNAIDFTDAITFPGLRRLIFSNFTYAADQLYCSFFLTAQVKQLQRFIPKLKVSDVEFGKAGVRAQALSPDGKLVDDFVFDKGTGSIGSRMLHVRNAPSPAATSSLAIAKMVADKAKELFHL